MSDTPLHRGAVHEAGHAVMARLLGGGIRSIKVDLSDPHGGAHTDLIGTEETLAPKNRMLISAASRACLVAFGCDVLHDSGFGKTRASSTRLRTNCSQTMRLNRSAARRGGRRRSNVGSTSPMSGRPSSNWSTRLCARGRSTGLRRRR